MSVYAYIRVSGTRSYSSGDSPSEQKERIKHYCQAQGLDKPIFIEEKKAMSGFNGNRPGFLKLKEKIKEGEVDTLIVYSLSRLSRSVKDTLIFIDDFIRKNNVDFISMKEDINTNTAMGKAFLGFVAIMDQLYRDLISERMKDFKEINKKNGKFLGGNIPYGYNLEGETLVADEKEQKTINLIKRLRRQGDSYRKIAQELKNREILTRAGSDTWSTGTLKKLLD